MFEVVRIGHALALVEIRLGRVGVMPGGITPGVGFGSAGPTVMLAASRVAGWALAWFLRICVPEVVGGRYGWSGGSGGTPRFRGAEGAAHHPEGQSAADGGRRADWRL